MGDGLKQAALDTLCSQGPWHTVEGDFTGGQLRACYDAVPEGKRAMTDALGIQSFHGFSDRRMDRALQLLRKVGLIEYAGKPRAWKHR